MRRIRPTLAALLLAGLATTAFATPAPRTPEAARWVRLDVVDGRSGLPLAQHTHRGEAWVAGERGQPYRLRLANLSGERLLVVLSVDGVNVVTGESADPAQSGYVLPPWASVEIEGWRKSLQEVAAFRFSDLPQSYAARTGRPFDVGVVGAAVFRERPSPRWNEAPPLASKSSPPPPAPAAEAASADRARTAEAGSPVQRQTQGLGTAHGERRWSPTRHTAFERASARPTEVVALRYDDEAGLLARGVIRTPRPWVARAPRPFPGGFVPDP